MNPFLKWAGGKRKMTVELWNKSPVAYTRYQEPMVGAGAFFFHIMEKYTGTRPPVIADINRPLINLYTVVQKYPDRLIAILRTMECRYLPAGVDDRSAMYYETRTNLNMIIPEIDHAMASNSIDEMVVAAAYMIFLNKTCFNGLWRERKDGGMNTPYGKHTAITIADDKTIRKASGLLANAEIGVRSYTDIDVLPGDFIYFDPPYFPASKTSNFTSYASGEFTNPVLDHETLRDVFVTACNGDARCMMTNSDTPYIRELYSNFNIDVVRARRSINSDSKKRGAVNELIIRNYR